MIDPYYDTKPYRIEAWFKRDTLVYLPEYPTSKNAATSNYFQTAQHGKIDVHPYVSQKQENDGKEGWICGRGVMIKANTGNGIQCFCPPSLYGEYCQYFNDRLVVVVSLSNIPAQLLEQESNAIKILALLLSNDDIVDRYIFHLPFIFSKELDRKSRFNLIYRRPKVAQNLYTVRFEAYHLSIDTSIKFLGTWDYPVQFSFLPSYRLVQILRFEEQTRSIQADHICRTANPCLHNSTCYPIMNKINSTDRKSVV